jgi:N4-gp56 family major capsid protein
MSSETTKYGDISQRTAVHAAKEMLTHAEPICVLNKYGQNKPLTKNTADTMTFRRPIPFPVVTSPLTEGVTPPSRQMQYEDVTVQIKQWGDVVAITDVVEDLAEDPVLKDSAMLCGEQAAETLEVVTWGVLKGGTNVFYGNGTSRGVVNTPLSKTLQRKVTRSLKNARGKKVTSMVGPSQNYETYPSDQAYIAFGHTDLEADIREMPGFTPTEQYGSMEAMPHEIGKVEDVRYILSPVLDPMLGVGSGTKNNMVSTDGVKVDVYPVIYIAKEAYGLVPLKGPRALTPTVLNPSTPTKDDPLGQRGFVGWKTYFEALILNETWMARVEVGASDLI